MTIDRYDYIITPASVGQRKAHAPSEGSTFENPEPQCCANTPKRGWISNKLEVIPVGHYERCSWCERIIEDMRRCQE